jgi:hypothetical protein
MGLMNSLKQAEERGKNIVRRGLDRAHQDMEVLRSGARTQAAKGQKGTPEEKPKARVNSAQALLNEDIVEAHDSAAAELPPGPLPRCIVSVDGRDVDPEELDKRAA